MLAVAEAELPDDLEELIIAILSDGYRSGAPRTYSSDVRSRIKLITCQFMIPGTYVQEEIAKMKGVSQNTFGMYGGKVLEKITNNEDPWMEARKGYGDSIPSSELLPKERIMKYYILINQKYGIDTEDGLRTYIHDMLVLASGEKGHSGSGKKGQLVVG